MVKQAGKVCLSVQKELEVQGKTITLDYEFSMPMNSSYGMAYDSAHEILREILTMADSASKQAERNKEEKE